MSKNLKFRTSQFSGFWAGFLLWTWISCRDKRINFSSLKRTFHNSKIDISIFLSNSYDQSEPIQAVMGRIRAICENGFVFGQILSKYYSRHTSGFTIQNLAYQIKQAKLHLDVIQERIRRLAQLPVDEKLSELVSENISKKLAEKYILEEDIGRKKQYKRRPLPISIGAGRFAQCCMY